MPRILITGATGGVGRALLGILPAGLGPVILTRRPALARQLFPTAEVAAYGEPLPHCEAIISLAGAAIDRRMLTPRRAHALLRSRLRVAWALRAHCERAGWPKCIVAASATGIYAAVPEPQGEGAPLGSGLVA
nr:hypothetical protein [Succinivibrionaceae bacterium]